MKANEIKTAAMNVISNNSCYTCKDVKNVYPTLVDTYGKDNAKAIVSKAKDILKAHAVTTKANAIKVIDGLKDGQRILTSTWNSILKDRSINQFAVVVYKMSDKSKMWKVWPVEAVPGFCATYCKSRMSAEWEQLKMEMASGVEWRITNPREL